MKVPIDRFESWLANKSLTEKTIKEYLYYFNKFVPYEFFDQESISRFLSHKGNMNGVAKSFLINYKKFLFVNYKEFNITKDQRMDISEVELPKVSGHGQSKLVKPLTENQVLEIEKSLKFEKEKIQLLMSFYGGLRIGELFKIQISSFNWDEWKKDMSQIGECLVHGKGNKEGIAFFPPDIMRRIATYIRSKNFESLSSYIFLKKVDSLEGIDVSNRTRMWQKHLQTAAIKANITQVDVKGKIIAETKVNPHRLRHSWGSHLKTVKNLDTIEIKEILRHSSIVSTQRYIHIDKSHIKKLLAS